MKRSNIKRKPTNRTKEAARVMKEFRAEHLTPGCRCWLCESKQAVDPHHIAKRRGDMYDDPRNLLAVCGDCHKRIDADFRTMGGRLLRQWTFEDVERAKRRHDPDNWDPRFLDYLRNWEKNYRETGRMEYQE